MTSNTAVVNGNLYGLFAETNTHRLNTVACTLHLCERRVFPILESHDGNRNSIGEPFALGHSILMSSPDTIERVVRMPRVNTHGVGMLLLAVAIVVTGAVVSAASEGRWKLGGDGSCYWDETDSGPDQCSANPPGRWKLGGDGSCYFDAEDSGADQCTPAEPDAPSQNIGATSERAVQTVSTSNEAEVTPSATPIGDPPVPYRR